MIKNVSFIIPVYNEQKRILNIHNWIKWFKKNTSNCELILSLNGCNDDTEKLVKKIKYKNFKCIISKQRGRGFAIIKALQNTKKKYACICSIDNAWNKKFYFTSYKKILSNPQLFCIYGPKNHKDSEQVRPIIRKIISIFSIIFLRILFLNFVKIDTQCIKMFRIKKNFTKRLKPYNYFFDTHFFIINKRMKMKYDKLPVKVNDNNKNSKVKLYLILEFIFEAIHFRFMVNSK
jgi:glycosyltransferase involved in cell wall biosynthesis